MRKLVLTLALSTVGCSAMAEVFPVVPEREWIFLPAGRTVIYGTPETDDVVIRIDCPDGMDQLRYEFVYDTGPTPWEELPKQKPDPSFPDPDTAAPILIQIDGKKALAGGAGSIQKYEFGDELLGWNARASDVKWQIEELLKKGGVATVSTGPGWEEGNRWSQPPVAQYKISLKGARSAIERLRKVCR